MLLPLRPLVRRFDFDIFHMSLRLASVPGFLQIPTNAGKTPPTLEEFDPLNPGEWQLGARGKILPRLPIGTKCGRLVMGQYGLYEPELRKRVQEFQKGLDEGRPSQEARPFDRRCLLILKFLCTGCLIITIWNLTVLIIGRPLPPYSHIKPVGSQ